MKREMKKWVALAAMIFGISTYSNPAATAQNSVAASVADSTQKRFTTASDNEEGGLYGSGDTALFRTWNKYISWSPETRQSSSMDFKLSAQSKGESLSFIASDSDETMQTGAIYKSKTIEQNLMLLVKDRFLEMADPDNLDEIFMELTYYDFDKDGKREVILSFVDYGSLFIVGYVLKFTNRDPKAPWEYLAEVRGQTFLYISRDTDEVVAPVGSQGLFDAYRFDGKEFVLSDSSFN